MLVAVGIRCRAVPFQHSLLNGLTTNTIREVAIEGKVGGLGYRIVGSKQEIQKEIGLNIGDGI